MLHHVNNFQPISPPMKIHVSNSKSQSIMQSLRCDRKYYLNSMILTVGSNHIYALLKYRNISRKLIVTIVLICIAL